RCGGPLQSLFERFLLGRDLDAILIETGERFVQRTVGEACVDAGLALGGMDNIDKLCELADFLETAEAFEIFEKARVFGAEREQAIIFLFKVGPKAINPVRGFLGDYTCLAADVCLK